MPEDARARGALEPGAGGGPKARSTAPTVQRLTEITKVTDLGRITMDAEAIAEMRSNLQVLSDLNGFVGGL